MVSYSSCHAYDNIKSIIRISDDVIFLRISDTKDNSEVSLTLNPTQARRLGELLVVAGEELEQCHIVNLLFGNIEVDIEFAHSEIIPF